jgi:hypothetical protein
VALTNIQTGCELVCEVEGPYNRRIKKISSILKEGKTEAVVRFKLNNPLGIRHRLFARVEKDGRPLVQKMGGFSMTCLQPADEDLAAYVWRGQPRDFKNGQDADAELKELKSGAAKMLFASEGMPDSFGMLYSRGALFAAAPGRENWIGAFNGWKYMVHDLGLNFRFISGEQLEKEKFDDGRCRIFILPQSLQLPAGQVEKLRKFVRKGGVLLADCAPAEVASGEKGQVYDVRAGRYLGETGTAETLTALPPAKLHAVLPYQVKEIELETGKTCAAGGLVKITAKIRTNGRSAGNHMARVEIYGPDKKIRNYYTMNVMLKRGKGEIELATALNDAKGKWEMAVRDAASGVQGKTAFEIQ